MRLQASGVHPAKRKGMVLLVVMGMLALFSSVALGFVFYADAEAVSAQTNLLAQQPGQPDIDTETLAAFFLSQAIYPTDNIYSSMRGWDLARSMYGYNPAVLNHIPYNGLGRAAFAPPTVNDPDFLAKGVSVPMFNMVNYMTYWDPNQPANKLINAVRTPEMFGKFSFPPGSAPPSPSQSAPGQTFAGGANPPWTYFDTNSFWLAQYKADGTMVWPSFVRPWMLTNNLPGSAPNLYMSTRPDPVWHPGFVLPDSEFVQMVGGSTGFFLDVKNIDNGKGFLTTSGAYTNNDAAWMDLGFGVHTAPNGMRFTALFAPTVVCLSNKLHLGVHGNRLAGGVHVSNQGFGPPEVNLGYLPGAVAGELQNLFDLRYKGPSGAGPVGPAGNSPLGNVYTAANIPWYAKIDANGYAPLPINASSPALSLPVAGPPFSPFPTYPVGWDNALNGGPLNETVNMPLGTNFFNLPGLPPQGPLSVSHMEALLRFGSTNSPAVTSEIFRRMPNTFKSPRSRNMVTLANWYLDRVATTPVISWDPQTLGNYQMMPGGFPAWPAGKGPVAPDITNAATYPSPAGDFAVPGPGSTDWRSKLGSMLRVNLNRSLRDYPPQLPGAGAIPPALYPVYNNALNDRKQFAKDIYDALVRVTGALDPNLLAPANLTAALIATPDYQASRWLAQLAVNIVDYIDNDDFVTPYDWNNFGASGNSSGAIPIDYVFGTETPRLVVNEVYAQSDNDPTDVLIKTMSKATPGADRLNVWVELHNPFNSTPAGQNYPNDNGSARLRLGFGAGAYADYQLVVCKANLALSAFLRNPVNGRGDLDPITAADPMTRTVIDWGGAGKGKGKGALRNVLPANGAFNGPAGGNVGFYVVGPSGPGFLGGRDPNLPNTYLSPTLSIQNNSLTNTPVPAITVLLRRLAVPHLPPNPVPGTPLYNPYITVDFMENIDITMNDNRDYTVVGPIAGAPTWSTPGKFRSLGRNQPYAASQGVLQTTTIAGSNPKTSFYQHNDGRATPFTWLTHLDRPLVNQIELLHASAFPPHLLTQQFMTGAGPYQHAMFNFVANQATGLYRALDVLGVPPNLLGSMRGGRVPGNININTVDIDPSQPAPISPVLQGLCDAQNANFNVADVEAFAAKVLAARTAGGPEGNPFRPYSSGLAFTPLGFVPANPLANPLIFAPASQGPAPHPYVAASLLQKIYNNTSTTSNVFAVWWTVGFFEVVDESVKPARLGQEIGRDQNRHIRHRFFAIVDRSGLQLFNSASAPNASNPNFPADQRTLAGSNQTMYAAPFSGTLKNGFPWSIQVGMLLEVDSGLNAEVVVVKSVNAGNGSFTADFTLNHNPGVPIVCRGNPGPQANYNPRRDTNVVLHMSVIQ